MHNKLCKNAKANKPFGFTGYISAALIAAALTPLADASSNMKKIKLWDSINSLTSIRTLQKKDVESTFGVRLRILAKRNEIVFYSSPTISLAEGGSIDSIDFRVKNGSDPSSFLLVNLAGTCFLLADVRKLYNFDSISPPGAHAQNPTTSYSMKTEFGTANFLFSYGAEKECLTAVSLNFSG